MKNPFLLVAGALFFASVVQAGASGEVTTEAQAKHYVCPSCGSPCDNLVFDKPGTCPSCGMTLVEQGTATAHSHALKKVAILIFNGVEIIDYTGPYEVFGAANFDVYTVAETKEPVTTAMGMTVVPRYTFADAPQPDVLVVPGGSVGGAQKNAAILKWVTDKTAHAEHTMSVCNGAFILASAGLLDGLTATTTSRHIDRLKSEYPKTKVVYNQRFVDNGKIITTAGLSAGIDGALHVVRQMLGEGYAQLVALGIEYDWRPQSGYARAALADKLIPDLDVDDRGKWEIVTMKGGTDHWELVLRPMSNNPSTAELMDHFGRALTKGKWTRVNATANRSDWKFTGRDDKAWAGTLTIQPSAKASPKLEVKLAIARAG